MQKTSRKPPRLTNNNGSAVVRYNGKRLSGFGKYNSPESYVRYAEFVAKWANGTLDLAEPSPDNPITLVELIDGFFANAFGNYANENSRQSHYTHYRILASQFLLTDSLKLLPVDRFTPKVLKMVRDNIIAARKNGKPRFCRNMVNDYVKRTVSIFAWGVQNELVSPHTLTALREVKPLKRGTTGTVERPKRREVPIDVIRRTLAGMPPTLRAITQLLFLTGCRPSEILSMRAGDIDTNADPDVWIYRPAHHKTERFHDDDKEIPLGKPEQAILDPFLTGKKAEEYLFSPQTAQKERKAAARANRQSKITPSQAARNAARANNPPKYGDCYTACAYRQAVEYAIHKVNRQAPEGEKIPIWFPYQIRKTAATVTELTAGLDSAQALLGHSNINTTKRYYANGQKQIQKNLARNRQNPF